MPSLFLFLRRLGAVIAALALLSAAACSSDDSVDPQSDSSASSAAAEASETESTDDDPEPSPAGFPVTIAHAFGQTTIEATPERVVSIGFTDHDALLALGVEPVAIRQWYGDFEFVWPWAEDALGDLRPEIIPSSDLNFEQIAALDPDLIIGQYIGLDEEQYDTLSAIAPTVAQPGDYPSFGAPWQLMTRNLGAATGKAAEADALISEVEDLFASARAEHPEFEGKGLAYAGVYGADSAVYYVETDGSTRMQVLQDLGFVVPEELAALGDDSFYFEISEEQLELLEQDVVLWEPAELALLPSVEENPIYTTLAVAEEGRDVFIDDPVIAGAMAHASVLSLPVVLDFLVPELDRAVANG